MMISILIAVAGLTGCYQSPEPQPEEARDGQRAEAPEEKLEQRVDAAAARERLAAEMREMASALENYQDLDMTPEAEQQLAQLQQRYQELARRLEAAGTEPGVIRELQDMFEELDRDLETYGRDVGT